MIQNLVATENICHPSHYHRAEQLGYLRIAPDELVAPGPAIGQAGKGLRHRLLVNIPVIRQIALKIQPQIYPSNPFLKARNYRAALYSFTGSVACEASPQGHQPREATTAGKIDLLGREGAGNGSEVDQYRDDSHQ